MMSRFLRRISIFRLFLGQNEVTLVPRPCHGVVDLIRYLKQWEAVAWSKNSERIPIEIFHLFI
jgi:hypothetical protein